MDSVHEVESEVEPLEVSGSKKQIGGKRQSPIYNYFHQVEHTTKLKCNYCPKYFVVSTKKKKKSREK